MNFVTDETGDFLTKDLGEEIWTADRIKKLPMKAIIVLEWNTNWKVGMIIVSTFNSCLV